MGRKNLRYLKTRSANSAITVQKPALTAKHSANPETAFQLIPVTEALSGSQFCSSHDLKNPTSVGLSEAVLHNSEFVRSVRRTRVPTWGENCNNFTKAPPRYSLQLASHFGNTFQVTENKTPELNERLLRFAFGPKSDSGAGSFGLFAAERA
jgi:hypothetical protein